MGILIMKKIKFGLKLWSTNIDLINKANHLIDEDVFDYIELFVIPGSKIKPFLIDIPYIIHIPHDSFGVNIGNPAVKEYTLQMINESMIWGDQLNAKCLILHAGYGSMQHAIDILDVVSDRRIIIENMPKVGIRGEIMIGYSPAQIQELIGDSKMGFCLDFGHAVKAAISLGIDYKDYINKFIKLKPKVFHISDGLLNNEKDEHLNINEGSYDFDYLIEVIKKNESKFVTLETPRFNQKSLYEDVKNINTLYEYIA